MIKRFIQGSVHLLLICGIYEIVKEEIRKIEAAKGEKEGIRIITP